MKRIVGLLGIIILVSAWPAMAQTESKGDGNGQVVCPVVTPQMFDPETVTSIKGFVECLAKFPQKRTESSLEIVYEGVVLQTGKTRYPVYLGPRWYLNKQKVRVKQGDEVTIIASKLSMDGNILFVAREVKRNGKTLMLRDEQGKPLWRKVGSEAAEGQKN